MSFAPVWSGNFRQIRSYVGSSCSIRMLKCNAAFFSENEFDTRVFCLRPLATKIKRDRRSHRNLCVHGGNVEISRDHKKSSDFHEYKYIQKISEETVYDRPATILVFDTETTGFGRWGRIIEIAIRDLLGGKNSTLETLINPGIAVRNTEFHGISSDMVSKPGVPSFEEFIPILLQFVYSRQKSGRPVLWIAHNARRFDVPFLIREFKRCSVGIPEDWVFLDALSLARQLRMPDGSKLSSIKLQDLREHYGIPLMGRAHRAMQDANILAYVVQKMTCELKLTIPELLQIAFRASDIVKTGEEINVKIQIAS